MVALITCPACGCQLAVPTELVSTKVAGCPECAFQFVVRDARARRFPDIVPISQSVAHDRSSPYAHRAAFVDEDAAATTSSAPGRAHDEAFAADSDLAGPADERDDAFGWPQQAAAESVPLAAELILPVTRRSRISSAAMGHHRHEEIAEQYQSAIALANRAVRSRKPSPVSQIAGIVVGGLVSIPLSLFALLWIGGPDRDVLGLSQHLPLNVLPASFRRTADLASHPVTWQEQSIVSGVDAVVPLVDAVPAILSAEGISRVRGTPAVTLANLSQAFRQARDAQSRIRTGSLASRKDRRVKGRAYMELCDLAHRATFVDDPRQYWAVDAAKQQVGEFLTSIVRDEGSRQEVAVIARNWINTSRSTNRGVVLVGHIGEIQRAGDFLEVYLESANGPLLSFLTESQRWRAGDAVVAAGSIVGDAQQRIDGYTGISQRVLWPVAVRSLPGKDRGPRP